MAQTIVYPGDDVTFTIQYYDTNGAAYDPPDVSLNIITRASFVVYGSFSYSGDDITKVSTGKYLFTQHMHDYIELGFYSAKWTADMSAGGTYATGVGVDGYDVITGGASASVVDGELKYVTQSFQVLNPAVSASDLIDPPRLYGVMRESPLYQTLGFGYTDRILLIGHADGVGLNEPMQVSNMQETINMLMGDADSPLVRGLLEVYDAGARDIWVMAAAPMDEYKVVSDREIIWEDWGNINFYEKYAQRLEASYEALLEYDFPEIIVPLEAPFHDSAGVDFLTPLVEHCGRAFAITGNVRLGVMGTRIDNWSTDDLDAMIADTRVADLATTLSVEAGSSAAAKFVMVVLGEGVFNLPQLPVSHTASLAATTAAMLATSDYGDSLTYKTIPRAMSIIGRPLTKQEIKDLARAKINPAIRTQRGKRGEMFNVVLSCDNTLALDGSDYWSIGQMRLVSKVMASIKALGLRKLGGIAYGQFKRDVEDFMEGLLALDKIRGYNLSIARSEYDRTKVEVNVNIKPYFGVREIFFVVEVGPGE